MLTRWLPTTSILVVRRLFPGANYEYTRFFLNANEKKTTSIYVISMHEIDPSAYVAQHENYFGTCNTNNRLQN